MHSFGQSSLSASIRLNLPIASVAKAIVRGRFRRTLRWRVALPKRGGVSSLEETRSTFSRKRPFVARALPPGRPKLSTPCGVWATDRRKVYSLGEVTTLTTVGQLDQCAFGHAGPVGQQAYMACCPRWIYASSGASVWANRNCSLWLAAQAPQAGERCLVTMKTS